MTRVATILQWRSLSAPQRHYSASRLGELVVPTLPLGGTKATRTDPARVFDDIKRLAVEQLGGLPAGLYRPIEQILLAPESGVASLRDQAALLVLRQHNASHVMRFRQQIAQGFDDFRGARAHSRKADMGLVDERLLDFHIAGERLGETLDERYQQPLEEMKGRLGALAGAMYLPLGLNPVAPSRLAAAFIEAIGDADLPQALAGLLILQYQQELVRVLEDLYPRINALLAAGGYVGVEPKSQAERRAVPMQGGSEVFRDTDLAAPRFALPPSPTPPVAAPAPKAAAIGHALQPRSVPRTSEELAGLRAQLHAWRSDALPDPIEERHPSAKSQQRGAPRRDLQLQEVTTIASLLQGESPDVYARALATSGRLAEAIREQISQGARRLGLTPDQTRLGVDEQDAIDMVAMLFEAVFRTHSLQERARRLYARLVLPYVKVALRDDAMFVHAGHPARRLFDSITEACEGNEAGTPQDRELLERAAAVSQRVMAEFNEDLAVFELAHAELEQLLQQQRRRVELQEDRAAKATHGRERLAEARAHADRLVQRRLAASPLTQAVAEFLMNPWRHHLVQTLLRDGVDSARHVDAAQLGDALVQADALAAAARGHDLADFLLALEPAIVHCQATSGLDDTAARQGVAWLVSALADPDVARQQHVLPARSDDEGGDDGARLWLAGGTDTVKHDAGVVDLIRRVKPGEWLRMIGAQGEATAVKVAWVSPLTSRLLLVNRRGMRVLVGSAEELAGLVAAGRLAIAADKTPFDESMQQLRERLDHAVGQR